MQIFTQPFPWGMVLRKKTESNKSNPTLLPVWTLFAAPRCLSWRHRLTGAALNSPKAHSLNPQNCRRRQSCHLLLTQIRLTQMRSPVTLPRSHSHSQQNH